MVREIARISSFHAYSIMTGSPQYLTILLIAKTTCVKVIIKRSLLGAPFENLLSLPCHSLHRFKEENYQEELKENPIMPSISF